MSTSIMDDRVEPLASPAKSAMPPKAEVYAKRYRYGRGALPVDGAARDMIQAPKPEPRIMRHELSDYEWTAIKPMLPNKPRGVQRVNVRRVLNGIFWVLRSGAPWRDLPLELRPPRSTKADTKEKRLQGALADQACQCELCLPRPQVLTYCDDDDQGTTSFYFAAQCSLPLTSTQHARRSRQ
ncbi:hypothetical protein ACVIHH_008065 [Bradyrhizobium sp. USDA 4518]